MILDIEDFSGNRICALDINPYSEEHMSPWIENGIGAYSFCDVDLDDVFGSNDFKIRVQIEDSHIMSYDDLKTMDLITIKKVLKSFVDTQDIVYDEDYAGWLLWGEKPIPEYLFEEETLNLNPKELDSYIENIIEVDFGLNRGDY